MLLRILQKLGALVEDASVLMVRSTMLVIIRTIAIAWLVKMENLTNAIVELANGLIVKSSVGKNQLNTSS